jgi:hypothetical protein
MYREDVVTTCREQGLGFLIQAKDTGAPGELMARIDAGEADGENNVRFAGLPREKRVNTFAYPIHRGEIGSEQRTESHKAWITDYDVEGVSEAVLRKYAYQFRDRWRVETAIRQLKHDFQGRCGSGNRSVRAFDFGAAQMFFNYWAALSRLEGSPLRTRGDTLLIKNQSAGSTHLLGRITLREYVLATLGTSLLLCLLCF